MIWAQLAKSPADLQPLARFDPATVEALPAPAARWLLRVLPEGAPLVDAVELSMTGSIKLGPKWMPFTAQQILRAGVGFVWKPIVGGRLVRFVGADMLGPEDARMEFRLHGLVPVAKASGPDVARSATGRLAAETVAWLPQATAPQTGARWTAIDDHRATVALDAGCTDVDVTVTVADDGQLRSIELQRWNDAADPPAHEPFGGAVTDEHSAPDGVRVAGTGAVGWGYGTPAFGDGEFFRFVVTRIHWIDPPRPGRRDSDDDSDPVGPAEPVERYPARRNR